MCLLFVTLFDSRHHEQDVENHLLSGGYGSVYTPTNKYSRHVARIFRENFGIVYIDD